MRVSNRRHKRLEKSGFLIGRLHCQSPTLLALQILAVSVGRNSAAHSAVNVVRSIVPALHSLSLPLASLPGFIVANGPAGWIKPVGYAPAKCRMRPFHRVFNEAVLDRVEMDVVEMQGEVSIVADRMLRNTGVARCRVRRAGSLLQIAVRGRAEILRTRFLLRANVQESRHRLPARSIDSACGREGRPKRR